MLLLYYSASCALLGLSFYLCKQYLVCTEKQLSWVLTLISSVVCSVSSLFPIYQFCKSGFDMHTLSLNTQHDIALVCFFQMYLVLDLTLGRRYYRHRITWVTGWLHHSLYLVLLTWFLKCRIPSFFVAASVLEIPTVILAIGAIRPLWRSDRLFAASFFSLRLVLHTWMIRLLKHYHPIRPLWGIALAILPLHLYWFYGKCMHELHSHSAHRPSGIVHLHAKKYSRQPKHAQLTDMALKLDAAALSPNQELYMLVK